MDLQIKDQLFLVGGAGSGFGKAIAETLLREEARVIAVARRAATLDPLAAAFPGKVTTLTADLSEPSTLDALDSLLGDQVLSGMVINAGGPPAKTVLETTLDDWDQAYRNLLRWKVALIQRQVPRMIKAGYGRILFVESASVKQPLENLVLSNSLRVAVVGMMKTLSQEIAHTGVTLNVLGPGSHDTPAIDRVYKKKSEQTGRDFAAVRASAIQQIPVGFLGSAADFASLAAWLLSPHSRYLTGQTITADGGSVKGML